MGDLQQSRQVNAKAFFVLFKLQNEFFEDVKVAQTGQDFKQLSVHDVHVFSVFEHWEKLWHGKPGKRRFERGCNELLKFLGLSYDQFISHPNNIVYIEQRKSLT